MKREVLPARSWLLEICAICLAVGSLAYASGCSAEPAVTALMLTPEGPDEWVSQVEEAAGIWNDALGCEALAVDFDGGLAVWFVESEEWLHPDTWRGVYTSSGIDIRETTLEIERATLVHELGHALGAKHVDDRKSVMYPIVGANYLPTQLDVEAAHPGC